MTYKEALLLREVRIKRYKKEKEALEKEREIEASKQRRNMILKK